MAASLSDFVSRVQNDYGETSTAFVGETQIQRWVQEAHNHLADTGYLISTMTASLVDGQINYDISGWIGTSSNRQVVRLLRVETRRDAGTQWYKTDPIDWDRLRALWDAREVTNTSGVTQNFSSEGNPTKYCWYKQYLYLWPVPSYDEDVALRLTFDAIELVSEANWTTGLPVKFEPAVVDFCMAMWHRKAGHHREYQFYKGEFEMKKSALSVWLRDSRHDEPELIEEYDRI